MKKEKIIIFGVDLGGGGAERVLSLLTEKLKDTYSITLILMEKRIDYEIPDGVDLIFLTNLKKNAVISKILLFPLQILRFLYYVKRKNPKFVFSLLIRPNIINCIGKVFFNYKAVISERSVTSSYYSWHKEKGLIMKPLIRIFYKNADMILPNSMAIQEDLTENFGLKKEKIKVIYNPFDIEKIYELSLEDVEHPWFKEDFPIIITVGNLVKAKGQWQLIRAFAKVRNEMPCRLVILGEGELRGYLEKLSVELGVNNDVAFLGWQKNPFKYLARSTVFVLPSLFEGFPNALIEAMVCEVPVISSNCSSGISEIISNGVNGMLVSVADEKILAEDIIKLLKNEDLRKLLIKGGVKRANDFNAKKVIEKYEKAFRQI